MISPRSSAARSAVPARSWRNIVSKLIWPPTCPCWRSMPFCLNSSCSTCLTTRQNIRLPAPLFASKAGATSTRCACRSSTRAAEYRLTSWRISSTSSIGCKKVTRYERAPASALPSRAASWKPCRAPSRRPIGRIGRERCSRSSCRCRQLDREHRSRPIRPIGRRDGALHGFHEAARDGKAEAGARSYLVTFLHPIELVEDILQLVRRYSAALVEDLQAHRVLVAPALDANSGAGRRIFCRVVKHVEQELFKQNGIERQHGQVGGQINFDTMLRQDLAGTAERAADDLGEIMQRDVRHDGTRLEPGHVEQIGYEAVEPLGFINDGCQQLSLGTVVERAGEIAQGACRAKDRRQGRLEIVGDRREQGRTQAISFNGALHAVHILNQADALDREGALIGKRIEQATLIRREQRPRLVAVDTDHPDGAATGAHGKEQPFRARQRVGTAA